MDVDEEEIFDIFVGNSSMVFTENSDELITDEISKLQNSNNIHDRLDSAKKLVFDVMPKTSIIVVENKIMKYLLPTLKNIHINVLKDIENNAPSRNADEKVKFIQDHLQVCITILQISDGIVDCIFKYELFDLSDIHSVPLNLLEILFLTFNHCNNSFYKELQNIDEILQIFKLAHEVHTKLINIMENAVNGNNDKEENLHILQNFLQVLVEIAKVLGCLNAKAMACTWRGYLNILQKFAGVLSKSCTIRNPINCLNLEIQKNFESLLNNDINVQNLTSTSRLHNFLLKIVTKLCDTLLRDDEDDWKSIFTFLLTTYRHGPFCLNNKQLPENFKNEIETLIFSPMDNLLSTLCAKSEFSEMLIRNNCVFVTSENGLFLLVEIFKKYNDMLESHVYIANVPEVMDLFFNVLSKGHRKIWMIILAAESNRFYEDITKSIAQISQLLSGNDYNKIEHILFKNIFNESVWNCLLASDIWFMTLRENPKLTYETVCNIIKNTLCYLDENVGERPQLIFLKSFLSRLCFNLPTNYKHLLFNQFSLQENFLLWKILGFKSLSTSDLKTNNFVIKMVLDKSYLFLNRKSKLSDFKILCEGLELVSQVSNINKSDELQLRSTLFELWKFIFNNNWQNSFYSTYFVKKVFPASNRFLLEFNDDQLLVILMYMKQLLHSEVDVKISLCTILVTLSRKTIKQSQNQISEILSEILFKLLTNQNQIIQQNVLEVFLLYGETSRSDLIFQNIIRRDPRIQLRISNFLQKKVVDKPILSCEEYFQFQSNHKFCHKCPLLTNLGSPDDLCNTQTLTHKNKDEINNVLKAITSNIELYYKLSAKQNVIEDVESIIRILER